MTKTKNLLRAETLNSKQVPSVLLAGVPTMDEVLTFNPESKWIYPAERDVMKNILPTDWKDNPRVSVEAQVLAFDNSGQYIPRLITDKSSVAGMMSSGRGMSLREVAGFQEISKYDLGPWKKRIVRSILDGDGESLLEADTDMLDALIGKRAASFVPFITGPRDRQLYPHDLLQAKSRAYDAWNNNPVGHRIPLIIAYFTVGRGVAAFFKDPMAQQIWDHFALVNGFNTKAGGSGRGVITGNKLTTLNTMLSVDGEAFLEFAQLPDTLRCRILDSSTILEIVTNPYDIEQVFYYHQQYQPQWQIYSHPDAPASTFVIKQLPPDSIIHTKINTFESEKRGRSDMMSVFGWLRRIRDIANATVTRAYMQSCQVWDVMVDGGNADVQRVKQELTNHPHRPGMAYVHNKAVERKPMGPTMAGNSVDHDMQGLMNLVALGTGIPIAYLLSSMGQNRQGVLTETEPSGKFFLDRQALNENILQEIKYRVFRDQRDRLGIKVRDDECEFVFPSVNMYDRMNFLNALSIMEDRQWFAQSRCATMSAKEFNVNAYNYEEEKGKVQQELGEKMMADTQRQAQSQLMMMGAQSSAEGSTGNEGQGSSGGPPQKDGGKKGPGVKFLGSKKGRGGNDSGGVDEGEADRTRKSLS